MDQESLNPGLDPQVVAQIAKQIDWRQAPVWAGAYIVVCVEHDVDAVDMRGNRLPRVEVGGCWMLHDTGKRVRAPTFGITQLQPGQSCIVRRPGSEWDGIAMMLLRTYFNHANILNLARDAMIEVPDPDYRPRPLPPNTALAQGIAKAMAAQRVLSRLRVQSRAQ